MTHVERVSKQYPLSYLLANPHLMKEALVCDNLDDLLSKPVKEECKVIPFPTKSGDD